MAFPTIKVMQQTMDTVSGVASQYLAGKQKRAYYKALKETNLANADINDIQTARQTAYINESAASQIHQLRQQGEATEGSAKAAMAASGMDLSSASAQAVLSSSERALKEDENLLRYQAETQAFEQNKQGALESASLRSQAKLADIAARQARYNAKFKMLGTLLTGAVQTGGLIFDNLQDEKKRNQTA